MVSKGKLEFISTVESTFFPKDNVKAGELHFVYLKD